MSDPGRIWYGGPAVPRLNGPQEGMLGKLLEDIREKREKIINEQKQVYDQQQLVQAEHQLFLQKLVETRTMYEKWFQDVNMKHETMMQHIQVMQQCAQKMEEFKASMQRDMERHEAWVRDAQESCPLEHSKEPTLSEFVLINTYARNSISPPIKNDQQQQQTPMPMSDK